MGFLGLFRRKGKARARKEENLLALALARVDLEERFRLQPLGTAGVCLKPLSATSYADLEEEVRGLLRSGEWRAGTRFRLLDDSYGYRWVVLQDPDLEDLVTTVHLVGQVFRERGFDRQLLAALFPFRGEDGRVVHWIYSFRRHRFYPFVPGAQEGQRDNALELALASKLEKTLPIEKELEQWYALWGAPLDTR